MTRVLVVDDHAVVRRGVRQILADAKEMTVTGEAATGEEALRALRESTYDVVLLDLSLSDRSGFDLLKQIKAAYPGLAVLVLTMHAEAEYAIRVLKAGASGYLTKESAPDLLVSAVQKVARGGKYLSPSLAETLASRLGDDFERAPHESLSDREFQVLCLMASGKGLTEIARELIVSVKTVSTHRARILQKMHLANNAELIRYALRHKLI